MPQSRRRNCLRFAPRPHRAQVGGDRVDGRLLREAVVLAGMHARAGLLVPGLPRVGGVGLAVHVDDLPDGQAVLLREGEVALVVARHRHHRALAVAHEHVVADPHLDRFLREGVQHEEPGGHPLLLHRGEVGLHHAALLALLDEGGERRVGLRGFGRERVFGRHGGEGDAHDRVGAGGVDLEAKGSHPVRTGTPAIGHAPRGLFGVGQRELDAEGAADPVALHLLHLLGPAQAVQRVDQLVGVLRDPQVPHGDLALLDRRARAPALAVDHLLVGEHGLVDRVPVHRARLLVGDALLAQAQEEPLVPAVVGGRAGGHLARPVDREPERLELALHVGDVLPGPLRGRHAVRHGGVLGGQAEGVPAHGLQDVEALHAQVVVERVVDRVVAHVPHVQLARRVGEHPHVEVLGLVARVRRDEGAGVGPGFLDGGLERLRVVQGVHCGSRSAVGVVQCAIIAVGCANSLIWRAVSAEGTRAAQRLSALRVP